MFLKSIFDDVFKCNHHPRWLRNGSCGEFELGTSGRYACGFCLRVRHPPKPISSICAMVKTFLYHGYLDPFTKIDWCPSSNSCWFFMFFWIIYPPGIKNGLLENPSAPLLLVQRPVPGTLPGGLGRINIDAEHWCFFCIFLRRVLYIQYIIQHTKDLLWMFYSLSLDFR